MANFVFKINCEGLHSDLKVRAVATGYTATDSYQLAKSFLSLGSNASSVSLEIDSASLSIGTERVEVEIYADPSYKIGIEKAVLYI